MNKPAKTATYLGAVMGLRGDARLYELQPPFNPRVHTGDDEYDDEVIRFVVVSGIIAPAGITETLILPATSGGEIVRWRELPGSFRGGKDHEKALKSIGYSVTIPYHA